MTTGIEMDYEGRITRARRLTALVHVALHDHLKEGTEQVVTNTLLSLFMREDIADPVAPSPLSLLMSAALSRL